MRSSAETSDVNSKTATKSVFWTWNVSSSDTRDHATRTDLRKVTAYKSSWARDTLQAYICALKRVREHGMPSRSLRRDMVLERRVESRACSRRLLFSCLLVIHRCFA